MLHFRGMSWRAKSTRVESNQPEIENLIDLSTLFFPTFDMNKFGKIHRHHWMKSALRFYVESDLLKANEDTAP